MDVLNLTVVIISQHIPISNHHLGTLHVDCRQTSLIALCFTALHRYCFFLQIESLWQPCIQHVYRCHFSNSICSVSVCVSRFGYSRDISNFHYYYICYGDRWSVTLDVTIVIVLGAPNHAHTRWQTKLLNVMCVLTAPLTSHSPISLPLLGSPYSLRHNLETGPINNPTMASKCSSERKGHVSLTLNQKLEMN